VGWDILTKLSSSHELFATFYSSIVTEFLAYNFRISWYMHIMKGLHIIYLSFQNYGRSLTHTACMVSRAQVHFIHALYRSLFCQLFIYFWQYHYIPYIDLTHYQAQPAAGTSMEKLKHSLIKMKHSLFAVCIIPEKTSCQVFKY